MAKERTSFVYVTYIRSTQEKVFEAITRPEIARRHWGHENVSEWTPGATWQHVRANEQRSVNIVGKVIEAQPPTRLVVTSSPGAAGTASRPSTRVDVQPRR